MLAKYDPSPVDKTHHTFDAILFKLSNSEMYVYVSLIQSNLFARDLLVLGT